MKIYQVIFQDEYINLYFLGFYKKLEDSLKDVNEMLSVYVDEDNKPIVLNSLDEYASTFNSCFDKEIMIDEGCVAIRGFVFDDKEGLLERWQKNNG